MNFNGVVIGLASFLIIGIFHPIVIKGEFYFGVRIWRAFLLAGIVTLAASLLCANTIASALLGVLSFTCFWSILEIFEQREPGRKGLVSRRSLPPAAHRLPGTIIHAVDYPYGRYVSQSENSDCMNSASTCRHSGIGGR